MFRILESQAPARQTATDTINTLSSRLQSSTLLEDRRAAILGLRSFAKGYPASVASEALRPLITSLRNDVEDVDTIKPVLETLLMLFSPEENSPEASDELALWLADEFTQRQDNITILLDLLDTKEFYSRLYSLQLISQISAARPERTQECILTAPLGISRIVAVLSDSREPARNEALLLIIALTVSSAELQKVVAFENAFDRIFSLIEAEGSLKHGSRIVEDCLALLGNLLQLNPSNQSFFRETGCVRKLVMLLDDAIKDPKPDEEFPHWMLEQRNKNIWGILAIIQLFLVKRGISTPVNQTTFWQSGTMQQLLRAAFKEDFDVSLKAKALLVASDLICSNATLQEKFSDLEVAITSTPSDQKSVNGNPPAQNVERLNVLEALLRLTLQQGPIHLLDARLASCDCIQAFFTNHSGIKLHFLNRAISGHTGGGDEIPNILSILIQPSDFDTVNDPYQLWLASVLLFHLIYEDPEAKAAAMKVTEGDAESGEEVVTCVQAITGNLITGIQRNDDERISVGYLTLLCGWLFEDPDVVNDFLGEGSSVQSLIQEAKQEASPNSLLPGLCAVLLGIIYEFSTKDSPIPRSTLHQLLNSRLGRELYIDKITKLREHPLVRDFEVLPQTAQGQQDAGHPNIFFKKTFIDFLKDNFSRLIRAIDRDPGMEVPVMANGIPKGISRELVDNLRAQAEERAQAIQNLESEMLDLQRKLDQEHLDHKRTKDSSDRELQRLNQVNESLQKTHQAEITGLEEHNALTKSELVKQYGEQLHALDNQLKQTTTEHERRTTKLRDMHETEVTELKQSVQKLEASLEKANKDHIQDLQTAHDEYSAKLSDLEAKNRRVEAKVQETQEHNQTLEMDLKEARKRAEKLQKENEESETARKSAQSELEDLLMVFSDLEAKRRADKKRLKALGEEVSDIDETDDEDEEEDEDESEADEE
ncbi:Vesicle-mediated ER to Golgi transport protein [Microsporum audouinii]